MTRAEALLAGRLLGLASEKFGNHGCNDMDKEMFRGIAPEELQTMAKAYNKWNGDTADPVPFRCIGDYAWMHYLSEQLTESLYPFLTRYLEDDKR